MAGMRCDYCGEMLLYQERIVTTFFEDGRLHSAEAIQGTCDSENAQGKYHERCYPAAAERDSSLPASPR